MNTETTYLFQQKYWTLLYSLKTQSEYLIYYHQHQEFIQRCLNICTNIASSASILGWIILNTLPTLWIVILAIAQLITVNSHHLPFKKRIEFTSKLGYALKDLCLSAESHWLDVLAGKLPDIEINKLIIGIKEKKVLLEKAYLCDNTLPKKNNLLICANQSTEKYFKQKHPGE